MLTAVFILYVALTVKFGVSGLELYECVSSVTLSAVGPSGSKELSSVHARVKF